MPGASSKASVPLHESQPTESVQKEAVPSKSGPKESEPKNPAAVDTANFDVNPYGPAL